MDNSKSNPTQIPFEEAILKAKVAQICDHVGYHAISQDSSNILVDLYRRTVHHLARHCKEAANNNRRVEPTLVDLVQAYDFVGISIPELQEHIDTVKIPLNVELEYEEPDKPLNRIQRNLLVDDLLEAEKTNNDDNDGENCPEDDDKPSVPLLKDTYQELSSKFSNLSPVKADNKIRPGRIVLLANKLKIATPLPAEPLASTSKSVTSKSVTSDSAPSKSASNKTSASKGPGKRGARGAGPSKKKFKTAIKPIDPFVVEPPSFFPILEEKPSTPIPNPTPVLTPSPAPKKQPKARKRKKSGNQFAIVTETVAQEDCCPECGKPDDGTLMVQCDDPSCARWFHGKCVGLIEEPKDDESWYCKADAQKHVDRKKVPSKLEPSHKNKPPSRSQRNQLADDLLAAENANNDDNDDNDDNDCLEDDDDKSSIPLLEETKQELSDKLANPSQVETHNDIRPGRIVLLANKLKIATPVPAESPASTSKSLTSKSITSDSAQSKSSTTKGKRSARGGGPSKKKLKTIKPLDPFAVEPPSFFPILEEKSTTPLPTLTPDLIPSPAPKKQSKTKEKKETGNQFAIVTETVAQEDCCPECGKPDDGTMMIQCDDPFCAKWFHGKCVNLVEEPKDDESWFCKVCVEKQQSAFKRRRRAK